MVYVPKIKKMSSSSSQQQPQPKPQVPFDQEMAEEEEEQKTKRCVAILDGVSRMMVALIQAIVMAINATKKPNKQQQ